MQFRHAEEGNLIGPYFALSVYLSSTLLELTDIYQMTEGIESRMKTAAATADSFEILCQGKTKDIHGHGSNDYLVMSC